MRHPRASACFSPEQGLAMLSCVFAPFAKPKRVSFKVTICDLEARPCCQVLTEDCDGTGVKVDNTRCRGQTMGICSPLDQPFGPLAGFCIWGQVVHSFVRRGEGTKCPLNRPTNDRSHRRLRSRTKPATDAEKVKQLVSQYRCSPPHRQALKLCNGSLHNHDRVAPRGNPRDSRLVTEESGRNRK